MLKDLLNKGKCTLGFHAEDWRYLRSSACQQASTCSRCQHISERVLHEWPEAWLRGTPGTCEKTRHCRRCRERETAIEHHWGPPVYASDSSCEQVRRCMRCAAETPAETAHVWEAWSYVEAEGCSQIVSCARCGTRGEVQRVEHAWGAWSHSPFYGEPVRVCSRCALMIFERSGADAGRDPVSMQQAATAVTELLTAQDFTALRERLLAHQRELLSPVATHYLRLALEQCASDASATDTLEMYGSLLERCRVQGIEATLDAAAAKNS